MIHHTAAGTVCACALQHGNCVSKVYGYTEIQSPRSSTIQRCIKIKKKQIKALLSFREVLKNKKLNKIIVPFINFTKKKQRNNHGAAVVRNQYLHRL